MKRFSLKKDGTSCGYATAWAQRVKGGWRPRLNVKEDPERPLTHATEDHRFPAGPVMEHRNEAIQVAARAAAMWANQYGAHAVEIPL